MLLNNLLISLSIALIKIYQKNISPILRKKICCRFYPSCSDYGIRTLEKHDFIKGWKKTINRIKRCRTDNYDSCVDYP
jgi:hypothetical protein